MRLSENFWGQQSATRYIAPVEEYKRTVLDLFPQVPEKPLDNCSIMTVDAVFLGYFLESLPQRTSVVEIGSFVGTSAFFFASHANVADVTCIDPNLPIADELVANSDTWNGRVDFEPLKHLKPFDVARETLSRFDKQGRKIRFFEGVAGTNKVGQKLGPITSLEKVAIPTPPENSIQLAYVDGLHTREGVLADLRAIFDKNTETLAILDDCRHAWGAFVQAGIVDFMEQTTGEYHFHLISDLAPSLATSNLGFVCADSMMPEAERALNEVKQTFSQRLDPLRLLSREEELIVAINHESQQLQQAKQQLQDVQQQLQETKYEHQQTNQKLQQANESLRQNRQSRIQLESRLSSLRYKAADAVAERAFRIFRLRGHPPHSE